MNYYVEIALMVICAFIAAIFHEFAHGYAAYKFGDTTAKMAGRLTLNPLKHIDLFGTILLPAILIIIKLFPLVFFKPVPINPENFINRRTGTMIVAMAGALTNFMLAFIAVMFNIFFISFIPLQFSQTYKELITYFVMINLILGAFNLIPIPPLDGSWIMQSFLPEKWHAVYQSLRTYFIIIFVVLLVTGYMGFVLGPLFNFLLKLSVLLVDLPLR